MNQPHPPLQGVHYTKPVLTVNELLAIAGFLSVPPPASFTIQPRQAQKNVSRAAQAHHRRMLIPETGEAIGEPEPWAGWETRLCLWSLALGIGGLLVLAVLLHNFLL
ncbi:MAG: hypothetical protein U5P41_08675 [Gammaproteobacteria bacterium]|nr:hypothetical protein [Gammaproteobacteria bacterium]